MSAHLVIRQTIRDRITSGEWALGARIPDEVELAEEFGCARATVNKAMQALAQEGLLIRKRKGGTRVNPNPVREARLKIPLLRKQVEEKGAHYSHHEIERRISVPPEDIREKLKLKDGVEAFYLETIHECDGAPFAFETRWVNLDVVPQIFEADFNKISANEWLVNSIPFSSGNVAFSACLCDKKIAKYLDAKPGVALFAVERTTWLGESHITTMRLIYHENYKLSTRL